MNRIIRFALAVGLGLAAPLSAVAQDRGASAPKSPTPTATVAQSSIAAPAADGGGIVDSAMQGVSDTVGAVVSIFNVTDVDSPASMLSKMKAARGFEFWAMVADAGFELKEADTDVGLIPEFSFKFDKARELSNADRVWLERKLRRHKQRHGGLAAKMKRGLIHALLEAHDLNEGFSLESFDVGFTPLPSLKFAVAPKDSRLLDKEHDALYRAILGNRAVTRRTAAPKGSAAGETKPANTR